MIRKFSCIKGCSDCCISREYYPSERYGKIGVLLLPNEVPAIQALASNLGVKLRILPRIATGSQLPDRIVAYQMMGRNPDGDLCPFLDIDSENQSPHGGHACRIYKNRPLACKAYPLIQSGDEATLDGHCKFCREHGTTSAAASTMAAELAALDVIKREMQVDGSTRIWRYATATGREEDREKMLSEGWVIEE